MLCLLRCICKLFSQGRVRDQQVASFVGSIAVLNKNKGADVGNRSKRGKCGSAPTRKTQWGARSSRQDPCPWIGSLGGNQTCIVPWLLWDLLLLKNSLTLNWGSKCLLSIFIFPESGLDPPVWDKAFSTISSFTLQISPFDVLSDFLSCVCKDNHPKQTYE